MKGAFALVLVMVIIMSSAILSAQLEISFDDETVPRVSLSEGGTGSTSVNISSNSSDYWDNLDTPDDISGSEFWYNQSVAGGAYPGDVFVNESGDIMTGDLNLSGNRLTDIGEILLSGNITVNANLTSSLGSETNWFKSIFVQDVKAEDILATNTNSTNVNSINLDTENATVNRILADGSDDVVVVIS